MKNTKRILALVLALVLSLSVFAGCQQTPAETTAPPAQNQTTAPAVQDTTAPAAPALPQTNLEIYPLDSDKVYEIALVATADVDNYASNKKWEELTGVEVEYVEWTAEQMQTALATQEMPDAIFYTAELDKAIINEYGQAGFFVNYADYLDYMPNFKKALEDYPDAINFVKAEDGSFYTLPRIGTTATVHGAVYIRTDMMNAAGWENLPATTEEFLQCMEDIQAHYSATDPDFSVFSAYSPTFLGWNSDANVLSVLYPSFGDGMRTAWDVIDGKVVFGAATEQYKRLMQYMNDIFNVADGKGFYLGKDIYTEDGTNAKAHAKANHVAVSSHLSFLAPDNFESGNIDMTLISPLTSQWQPEKRFAAASNYTWVANCINASLPEEDIITLVRWFDSHYAQEENPMNEDGTIWGIYHFVGEYGVDWSRDEEAGTYSILPHEGFETPGEWQFASLSGLVNGLFDFNYASLSGIGLQAKALGTNKNTLPYASYWFDITMLTLNEDEQATYADYWTEIDTYITEKTAKYITGELDVEADWDTFLADLENLHLQDVIDAYQSAYDRFIAN